MTYNLRQAQKHMHSSWLQHVRPVAQPGSCIGGASPSPWHAGRDPIHVSGSWVLSFFGTTVGGKQEGQDLFGPILFPLLVLV